MRRFSICLAAVSLLVAGAGTARAHATSATETTKQFRIHGAQVVQFEPLVVRTGANTGVSLWLDGSGVGSYLGSQDVRVSVYGEPGVANLAAVPSFGFDYGSETTELTFYGAADAWVDGLDLVVLMAGVTEVVIEAGAGVLPVEEPALGDATDLRWYYPEIPWSTKEFRIGGAEVIGVEPLVVRIGAHPGVLLCADGGECQGYLGEGDVRIAVVGLPGVADLPELPSLTVDYGAATTEITFVGAAEVHVEGLDLVVRMTGVQDVTVELGADHLPVAEAMLNEAGSLGWVAEEEDVPPHKP